MAVVSIGISTVSARSGGRGESLELDADGLLSGFW